MTTTPLLFVGIDIAAKTFTASFTFADQSSSSKPRTFDQTESGYTALHAWMHTTKVSPEHTLIVLEATGSYWVTLASTMHALGYRLCVLNPASLAKYAQSQPRRNKDDDQDSSLITTYARRHVDILREWSPPPQVYHELRQRLQVRESLISIRTQLTNQLHALSQWPVQIASAREHLEQTKRALNEQIRAIDKEMQVVLKDGAWAASASHLMSITGVGVVTASWLLATTVNFTLCASADALVHFAGLVPLKHDSGSSVHGRAGLDGKGHAKLRRALYLATMSGVRHNGMLKTFYNRLIENGKPKKLARCACARKLAHICYAVVTKECDFDPSYQKLPSSRGQEREHEVQIGA